MTTAKAGVSLADLNARKASATPYEFEYVNPRGELSGIFLSVIGSHSDEITGATIVAADEDRRRDSVRAAKNAKARPESAEIGSLAEDIDGGLRLTAKRLIGWRGPGDTEGLTPEQLERFQGISDPWSPENALLLCRTNADIAMQVTTKSNDLGNFMGKSPKS